LMQHFLLVLLLSVVFAVERKPTDLKSEFSLPNSLREAHYTYEGTIKSSADVELPITGEFWFHVLGNKHVEMLDKMNIEYEGKTFVTKHLTRVNAEKGKIHDFFIVNNKCLAAKYTKERETYPRVSEWRKLSNSKFERTFSNKFSLNDVLKFRSPRLGASGSDEHDVQMRMRLTLEDNKITHVEIRIMADGEELATKSTKVISHKKGKIDESLFQVPSICKSGKPDQQSRVVSLAMFFFGVDTEGKSRGQFNDKVSDKNSRDRRMKDEQLTTQGDTQQQQQEGGEVGQQEGQEKCDDDDYRRDWKNDNSKKNEEDLQQQEGEEGQQEGQEGKEEQSGVTGDKIGSGSSEQVTIGETDGIDEIKSDESSDDEMVDTKLDSNDNTKKELSKDKEMEDV